MTPIIEGLDGVQKMSKSLNNAIGIHEPAQEMYGKLMSINDELMWRYWELLTDLRQSEIDQMRSDVASGTLHPMEAETSLARTIVSASTPKKRRTRRTELGAPISTEERRPRGDWKSSINLPAWAATPRARCACRAVDRGRSPPPQQQRPTARSRKARFESTARS